MLSVLAFLLVLGVLIFVHELGHLLAAKWSGMYVHRFSIGMGPTIKWATRTIGETEYTLSWLPLGGYVRVATGEEAGKSLKKDKVPDRPSDEKCHLCGSAMVIKTGRFGEFLACTTYPNCKGTRSIPMGIKCPQCVEGDLSERRAEPLAGRAAPGGPAGRRVLAPDAHRLRSVLAAALRQARNGVPASF